MTIPWLNSGQQVSDRPNTEPIDEHSLYSPFSVVFYSDCVQEEYGDCLTNDRSLHGLRSFTDCFDKLKTVLLFRVLSTSSDFHERLRSFKGSKSCRTVQLKRSKKRKVNIFWKLLYVAFSLLISCGKHKQRDSSSVLYKKSLIKKIPVRISIGSKISWISLKIVNNNHRQTINKKPRSVFLDCNNCGYLRVIAEADICHKISKHLEINNKFQGITYQKSFLNSDKR